MTWLAFANVLRLEKVYPFPLLKEIWATVNNQTGRELAPSSEGSQNAERLNAMAEMADGKLDKWLASRYAAHPSGLVSQGLAARLSGCSRAAIRKATRAGKLRCYRYSYGPWPIALVPLEDVRTWQASRLFVERCEMLRRLESPLRGKKHGRGRPIENGRQLELFG